MAANIIVLLGLLQLLNATDKPFLCSAVYAITILLFGLASGIELIELGVSLAIVYAGSSLYFWLLSRFSDSLVYWLIMPIGCVFLLF